MSDYTKAQAKDSDRILAEHQAALYHAMNHASNATSWVLSLAGASRVRTASGFFWSFDGKSWAAIGEAETRLRNKIESGESHPQGNLKAALDKLTQARDEVTREQELVDAGQQRWSENGQWARYFAVMGGHIHSSTQCRSLRVDTRVGWLPELSGETEDEAVAQYGSVLCTFCFPSAPVEWTRGTLTSMQSKERREVRERKQAEALSKVVIDPATAQPLRNVEGRELKTERAASNALLEALFDLRWYGKDHPDAPAWEAYVERGVPALARYRGVPEDGLRQEFAAKAEKKYQREMR